MNACQFFARLQQNNYPDDNFEYCDVINATMNDGSLSNSIRNDAVAVIKLHHDAEAYFIKSLEPMLKDGSLDSTECEKIIL